MQDFDAETAARVIAENAVAAFLQYRSGPLNLKADARLLAIGAVMAELVRVLPTSSGAQAAEACNRGLAFFNRMGIDGPAISDVDMDDGSVTVRPG
ncbi:hypothetical protein [Methylobacterium sp.]|uniref:hypothetical protein n=1 Tax=Methylobacterium sp. TaxID=409 RepID=UPI000C44FDD7|nr:hypothetical protein [Methylobacterium sp.]MBP28119.1 hypothetical protein [Methylobacterium sp.]